MAIKTIETRTELISGEELVAMGDIGPSELVAGRIVRMSPTGSIHGRIEGNFYDALRTYLKSHKLGTVMVGEVGIYTHRNPDTIRAADVLYISNEGVARLGQSAFLDVAPDLVVEILSPDDRWQEVTRKLREYFEIGVRLVWVAEPESGTVYAYRSLTDVREFGEKDNLPGDDVLPGFSVPVAPLFEE